MGSFMPFGPIQAVLAVAAVLIAGLAAPIAAAEDGYDLWLRYRPVEAANLGGYRAAAREIVVPAAASPTLAAARDELNQGLGGMLGRAPRIAETVTRTGAVVIGTPANSPIVASLNLPLQPLGHEGFLIRSASVRGRRATIIAANSDVGVLYGAFHFLRLMQTRQPIGALDIASAPRVELRMLDHWDNLDGTIERGYAGHSIWDWHKLPDYVDPRYTVYARANASLGVNGACVTNVAASAVSLTPDYIRKAAALADALRPYGIKLYLTARFSAPREFGAVDTADPLDPRVRAWWKSKVDEIYQAIPDFGGFLVKANSEGQPGPQDYHRTHADGANMLAEALAPHGGIVLWRAFVYSAENPRDRAMQAYDEFVPLDGQFLPNVIVQVKNGPIDFQPREPFHPLFGAMARTPTAMEFQITKEYLGLATSLAYLAPLYEEALDADTHVQGAGSTVARVIDGSLFHYAHTAMAGVSNIGDNRNWTGSHFDQANWYAFGRLAWDPSLSSAAIGEEWTRMTFSNDPAFVGPVVGMMMRSREAPVDYMTPLGLAHQMARGHHYGPGPWVNNMSRPEWNSTYYNRADAAGLGFDRSAAGSNAVSQYAPPVAARYGDIATVPEDLLLWFHHAPWDHRMASGRTLWEELVARYSRGVAEVHEMRETWARVAGLIDAERAAQITAFLEIQENEAKWWRDASIAYFQTFSQRPMPEGYAPPEHPLEYYKAIVHPFTPGWPGVTAAPFRNSATISTAQ
jgi:alpha-glucuronidase